MDDIIIHAVPPITPCFAVPIKGSTEQTDEAMRVADEIAAATALESPTGSDSEELEKTCLLKTESDRGSLPCRNTDMSALTTAMEPEKGDKHDKIEIKVGVPDDPVEPNGAGPMCSFCGEPCSKLCRTGGRQWRHEKRFLQPRPCRKEGDP